VHDQLGLGGHRPDVRRELEVPDVDRVVDVELRDIDTDAGRDGIDAAEDLEIGLGDLQLAALAGPGGDPDAVDGHLDLDLVLHVHADEVDVLDRLAEDVPLHRAEERCLLRLPEREADQRAVGLQDLLQVVGLRHQVDVVLAAAIEVAGDLARTTVAPRVGRAQLVTLLDG
jgi:hypothetical protein